MDTCHGADGAGELRRYAAQGQQALTRPGGQRVALHDWQVGITSARGESRWSCAARRSTCLAACAIVMVIMNVETARVAKRALERRWLHGIRPPVNGLTDPCETRLHSGHFWWSVTAPAVIH
jgi:hypothetical protein